MYSSENDFPRIIFLLSATANGILKYIAFVSIGEKQVTEIYCFIGTSIWFAIVDAFDVSCWSSVHTFKIWKIIGKFAMLSTKIDALLSNRKRFSVLKVNLIKFCFENENRDYKTNLLELEHFSFEWYTY